MLFTFEKILGVIRDSSVTGRTNGNTELHDCAFQLAMDFAKVVRGALDAGMGKLSWATLKNRAVGAHMWLLESGGYCGKIEQRIFKQVQAQSSSVEVSRMGGEANKACDPNTPEVHLSDWVKTLIKDAHNLPPELCSDQFATVCPVPPPQPNPNPHPVPREVCAVFAPAQPDQDKCKEMLAFLTEAKTKLVPADLKSGLLAIVPPMHLRVKKLLSEISPSHAECIEEAKHTPAPSLGWTSDDAWSMCAKFRPLAECTDPLPDRFLQDLRTLSLCFLPMIVDSA